MQPPGQDVDPGARNTSRSASHQRESLDLGLGDEQPVEGITVVPVEPAASAGVLVREVEFPGAEPANAGPPDSVSSVADASLPEPHLGAELVGRYRRDQDAAVGVPPGLGSSEALGRALLADQPHDGMGVEQVAHSHSASSSSVIGSKRPPGSETSKNPNSRRRG